MTAAQKTIQLVADRLYKLGSNNKSTTTSTIVEPLGEELQRLSFILEKVIDDNQDKKTTKRRSLK